jgi:glycosyltransferase involved in cell wall biosynthesis
MGKLPITVIVPVRNEEKNLPNMLPLLADFDEVIVVDSRSTDKTPDIAKSFGYQLVEFDWNGHFPKKRNWTLRNVPIKNEWVFFVDADEYMTPEFMKGLRDAFEDTKDNVGYWIYYTNYFMGRLLKHGDPIHKLALFKKSAGEYEKIDAEDDDKKWGYAGLELHEQPVLEGGAIGIIRGRIDHKENRGLEAYIKKHNEFSTWEAIRYLKNTKDKKELTFRQKIKYSLMDSWWLSRLYFLYIYFFKLGFLDGRAGYVYAQLKKQYFFNIKAKIDELRGN